MNYKTYIGILNCWRKLSLTIVVLLSIISSAAAVGNNPILVDMDFNNSLEDDVKIVLQFIDSPKIPKFFSIEQPNEMIFDFINTECRLPKKKLKQSLSLDLVKNIAFVKTDNKVRMIVKVKKLLPYDVEVNGSTTVITLKNKVYDSKTLSANEYTISALDFNRGAKGEGKLLLDLQSGYNDIDLSSADDGKILLKFRNASIPEKLLRNFDVSDFGTPIKNIQITKKYQDVWLNMNIVGDYEKISYHTGDKYVIEARPYNLSESPSNKVSKFKFSGEKISLNFQDIEIRAVLQLLADFTGMNIIANDSVNGNVTLRLDNIPWDQALDFILKSKGLAKRQSGNVVLIALSSELSKYEESELSSSQQLEALAPLKTEFIRVNYAKADEIAKLIQDSSKNSMLSKRGTISVDSRTNTLLLKDIDDKISEVKDLVTTLDVPIKQVLIEAYIVQATQSFIDNLGIGLNAAGAIKVGNRRLGITGLPSASGTTGGGTSSGGTTGGGTSSGGTTGGITGAGIGAAAMQIAQNGIGSISSPGKVFSFASGGEVNLGFALSRLPGGILLNLELDLAETETISTNIAKPRVLTLDNQSASIESGQDIPYQTSSNNGGTNTTFQKASIKLQVTPKITPNNQISMDLSISNDSPTQIDNFPQLAIKTASVKTNVLVDNGETIVLGGLMTDDFSDTRSKVPFMADLPLIGGLFRNSKLNNAKKELLFFITPKIVIANKTDPEDLIGR